MREAGRLALRSQEAITAGSELEKSVVSFETGLRGYVGSGDRRALAPYNAAQRLYRPQLARLRRLARGDAEQERAVATISEAIDDYLALWATPLLQLVRDQPEVARSQVNNIQGRERVNRIRTAFDQLFARERSVADSRARSAERRADLGRALGIGGAFVIVGLLLLVGL